MEHGITEAINSALDLHLAMSLLQPSLILTISGLVRPLVIDPLVYFIQWNRWKETLTQVKCDWSKDGPPKQQSMCFSLH
jgi:hypothetical protein